MSVSHEIKSQLAKLLATEDLVVEHRKVETAQFNVHTRVLTLPLWEKASNVVYDLLVGHEVGHALFTPDEDWNKSVNIPMQYVNIVEDARIEKLMKRKYMGLAKTFFNGYRELSDKDFFSLEGEDISKMTLADKANLFFKIGNYVDIPIQDGEEKEIIDAISDVETFADVLTVSEILYKYCKKKAEEEKIANIETPSQDDQKNESQEPQQQESPEGTKEESEENSDEQQESKEGTNQNDLNSELSSESSEPEVRTVDNLEEKLKELISKYGEDNVYAEVPQVNLDTVIAKNEDIHELANNHFNRHQRIIDQYRKDRNLALENIFSNVDLEYRKFKSSAQKEVNYLVKEFECRKSADAYARASTARTGVLDTTKLHTYKYNEDLFRKVTVIPDGKNHGLIFVLYWSGSMSSIMEDTCKQLFNLIWFCKKSSIPF
jgi:chemotaxis protein histidine kinase CheA